MTFILFNIGPVVAYPVLGHFSLRFCFFLTVYSWQCLFLQSAYRSICCTRQGCPLDHIMIWPKILEQCLVSLVPPEALGKYINISSFIFCSQCNMKGPWAQISLPSLPKFPQIHDSPVCKPLSSTFASLGWPSHRTSHIYDFSSLALVSFVVRKLPVSGSWTLFCHLFLVSHS